MEFSFDSANESIEEKDDSESALSGEATTNEHGEVSLSESYGSFPNFCVRYLGEQEVRDFRIGSHFIAVGDRQN